MPYGNAAPSPSPNPETETQTLKARAKALQSELNSLRKRLNEIEAKGAEK